MSFKLTILGCNSDVGIAELHPKIVSLNDIIF
jgi:hypothetical protein